MADVRIKVGTHQAHTTFANVCEHEIQSVWTTTARIAQTFTNVCPCSDRSPVHQKKFVVGARVGTMF